MRLRFQKEQQWLAIVLCAGVMVAEAVKLVISGQPGNANNSSPDLVPFVAALLGAAGIIRFNDRPGWITFQKALLWGGLLLMVWTANGLLFDLLRLTPLMPQEIDLPGMAARTIALAAVLCLLLVNTPRWMPRRLLLSAGWTATVIVAMIGPAAFWMIITSLVKGGVKGPDGMAAWVPFLFYGSWFLFAIAAGAATLSYQLRSARPDTTHTTSTIWNKV